MSTQSRILESLLLKLAAAYPVCQGWPKGEWPVNGGFQPPALEIVVGAILVQNTAWRNVELALARMIGAGLTSLGTIRHCRAADLEESIRPAGFFRQKARTLRDTAEQFAARDETFLATLERAELLSIKGIGEETADAILLYALGRKEFIGSAYARRFLSRIGLLQEGATYPAVKAFCELNLPAEVTVYRRFHALIVEHCRVHCRTRPACDGCPVRKECGFGSISLRRRRNS